MVISKDELKSIVSARCGLPQEFLGMHKCKGGIVVRAYIVNAKSCHLVDLRKSARKSAEMEKLDPSGFFELFIKSIENKELEFLNTYESITIYNFETFLNPFHNLRSISQNAHWLKKQ